MICVRLFIRSFVRRRFTGARNCFLLHLLEAFRAVSVRSIDRPEICGMLRTIGNNIKGVI